jgi:hypothetical protein
VNKTSANALSSFPRKRAIFLAAILGAAFVLPAAVGANNKTDQRAEARALIQRALDVSDLRAPGSPPFEIRGSITVPLKKGQNATGTYLLDWVSPDRWREEIHVANYSRIRVGGVGKYWQLRSIPYELMAFDTFTKGINFAEHLRSALLGPYWDKDSKAKILLKRKKLDGVSADCMTLGDDTNDFCFDIQSGRVLRNGSEVWEMTKYSGYETFAEKFVPSALDMSALAHPVGSFKLQSISKLDQPDEALFIPPQGAEPWPTCDAPVLPELVREKHPDAPSGESGGTVLIYGVLGTDGIYHNLQVLEATSTGFGDSVLKSWQSAVYKPQTCHGVTQKTEGIGMAKFERH